jgi:hypothetical protein
LFNARFGFNLMKNTHLEFLFNRLRLLCLHFAAPGFHPGL